MLCEKCDDSTAEYIAYHRKTKAMCYCRECGSLKVINISDIGEYDMNNEIVEC